MIRWLGGLILAGVLAGCAGKPKPSPQVQQAFLQGQRQGMAAAQAQAQGPSVWIVGKVQTPLIPWTENLTLSQALITAKYQGAQDPTQITIFRIGQRPIYMNPRLLLQGQDVILEAGDRVEIR
jgi:hypothetical protein